MNDAERRTSTRAVPSAGCAAQHHATTTAPYRLRPLVHLPLPTLLSWSPVPHIFVPPYPRRRTSTCATAGRDTRLELEPKQPGREPARQRPCTRQRPPARPPTGLVNAINPSIDQHAGTMKTRTRSRFAPLLCLASCALHLASCVLCLPRLPIHHGWNRLEIVIMSIAGAVVVVEVLVLLSARSTSIQSAHTHYPQLRHMPVSPYSRRSAWDLVVVVLHS